jgi:hypothetical protein
MTDPRNPQPFQIVEHNGYQIRLSQSGLEWMAFVARPQQRPILIMAPDYDAAITKAREWIELQRKAAGRTT